MKIIFLYALGNNIQEFIFLQCVIKIVNQSIINLNIFNYNFLSNDAKYTYGLEIYTFYNLLKGRKSL